MKAAESMLQSLTNITKYMRQLEVENERLRYIVIEFGRRIWVDEKGGKFKPWKRPLSDEESLAAQMYERSKGK